MKSKLKGVLIFLLGILVGVIITIPYYYDVRPVSVYDTPECKNFVRHIPDRQFLSKPYGKNKTFIFFTSTYDDDNEFYVLIGQKEGLLKNISTINYSFAVEDDMLLKPEENIPDPNPAFRKDNMDRYCDFVYFGIVPQNVKSVLIDGKEANLEDMSFSYSHDDKVDEVNIKFYYLIVENTENKVTKKADIEVKY